MKTFIILLIVLLIIARIFYQIYKDYKKNGNFCGKDCCSCNSSTSTESNCKTHK